MKWEENRVTERVMAEIEFFFSMEMMFWMEF